MQPSAFLPDFASSLNSLSLDLSELGQNEEALRAIQEAIRTLTPFFVRHPGAFFTEMLMIVRTYIELQGELGQEPDEQLLNPILDLLSERRPPPDSNSSG